MLVFILCDKNRIDQTETNFNSIINNSHIKQAHKICALHNSLEYFELGFEYLRMANALMEAIVLTTL